MIPLRRRTPPSLRRVRLLLAVAGLVLALGIGLLGDSAVRTTRREQALKHEAVAARIFDELEGELTELVRQEEARPFLYWRHLYVPDDQLIGQTVAVSPLAPLPSEDYLVGYFQYNPDGTLVSPHAIARDEAVRYNLSTANPEANDVRVEELAQLTEGIDGWRDDRPPPLPAPAPKPRPKPAPKPAPKPELLAKLIEKPVAQPAPVPAVEPEEEWQFALNNASAPRQMRTEQLVQAPVSQLDNFLAPQQAAGPEPVAPEPEPIAPEPEPIAPEPEPVAPEPEPVAPEPEPATLASIAEPAPVPADPDRPTDVVISPMAVRPGPDDSVIFSRTVRIEDLTWVQGVVYRRGPLQRHIEAQALGVAEPLAALSLDWDGPGDASADYRYTHFFDAPFDDWSVTASLASLSSDGLDPTHAVLLLTALAALAGALGLLSAYRTAAASLAWAEQRESFVAAVTHELKTPLTSIQMYAEMLRGGVVADEDRRQRYYGTIHDEATRLGRLVDDVLAFSRLDRGAPRAVVATGTARDAVGIARAVVEPRLEAAGRPLRVTLGEGTAEAAIDRDRVVHVLTNLLDNAVKFGGDAPVSLTVTRDGPDLVFVVADGGPGVDRGLQRAMFEPFVRGEDERTRETQGTGLGLALVRALVDEAGGVVRAENRPEGGLAVTVRLPVPSP